MIDPDSRRKLIDPDSTLYTIPCPDHSVVNPDSLDPDPDPALQVNPITDPVPDPGFWWPKLENNTADLKLQFTFLWDPWKDIQAKGEAFSPQKKTSST
jgi:hypothetical protein